MRALNANAIYLHIKCLFPQTKTKLYKTQKKTSKNNNEKKGKRGGKKRARMYLQKRPRRQMIKRTERSELMPLVKSFGCLYCICAWCAGNGGARHRFLVILNSWNNLHTWEMKWRFLFARRKNKNKEQKMRECVGVMSVLKYWIDVQCEWRIWRVEHMRSTYNIILLPRIPYVRALYVAVSTILSVYLCLYAKIG